MQDKIVLVTGATDGIGKQIALELAQLGATALLHGRSAERGQPAPTHADGRAVFGDKLLSRYFSAYYHTK